MLSGGLTPETVGQFPARSRGSGSGAGGGQEGGDAVRVLVARPALDFDWDLIARSGLTGPFMLSGGLTPETVAGALATTGARAVDEQHPVGGSVVRDAGEVVEGRDPERLHHRTAGAGTA
jgi:hypothetical protein